MNREVANECTKLSDEEKITFPEVVRRLMEAGVELYYADLLSQTKTYYAGSDAYTVPCARKGETRAADSFDQEGVIGAIKQIQAGKIQYQEFVRKILDAGTVSYMVFIKGRKAVYFGRRGEEHVEKFPK